MPGLHLGRCGLLLASLAVAGGMVGCQPAPGEVAGTVLLKGKAPNTKGLEIMFLAPNGRFFGAPINPDGTYTVSDVAAGEARVCFVYAPVEAKQIRPHIAKPVKDSSPPQGSVDLEAKNPIPSKLRDATTSNLTVNVTSGAKTVFNYDIQPEVRRQTTP